MSNNDAFPGNLQDLINSFKNKSEADQQNQLSELIKNNLSQEQNNELQTILNDREALEKLMEDERTKKIMEDLK